MTEAGPEAGAGARAGGGAADGGPRRIQLAGVRRAPRFRAFVWTGGLAGFAVGLLIAVLAPGDPGSQFSGRTVAGFLGMALALFGALAGGGAAVLADRRSRREL